MSYGRNYSWILQKCFLSCGYCDTALYKAIFFDNGPLFFKIFIIYTLSRVLLALGKFDDFLF